MNEKISVLEESMRNAVNVLKGRDDPRIDEITAYMREYVRRSMKAKRSEFADPRIDPASAPPPPLSRLGFRRF
jgi:hypothetical protein